jgi:hypothetical protein
MKRVICAVAGCLLLGGAAVSADQGRGRQADNSRSHAADRGVSGEVHVVFSTGDVHVIREHYAPKYKKLPKGLQKKLARTGQLPPGWQKKIEPFPVVLERQLVVLPAGYRRGVIDGNAVIYHATRGVIIDATILF